MRDVKSSPQKVEAKLMPTPHSPPTADHFGSFLCILQSIPVRCIFHLTCLLPMSHEKRQLIFCKRYSYHIAATCNSSPICWKANKNTFLLTMERACETTDTPIRRPVRHAHVNQKNHILGAVIYWGSEYYTD